MNVFLAACLVLGYSLGLCLMFAFWAKLPPYQFWNDLATALIWPVILFGFWIAAPLVLLWALT